MSPTRRQVVNAIAAGAVVPVTVAPAEAQEQDSQDFSPDITISPNNLVATIGERDDDVDPDTVSITTADGRTHEFDGAAEEEWNAGTAFDVGYTKGRSRARIDNWHGIIRQVTATRGDESVTETNDRDSTLEVTCSMWRTPDQPPTEFAVVSAGATKQHWNRGDEDLSEDQRQYGSPGRPLQTVIEHDPEIEMQVDFEGCTPETEKALRFDCTSVTVEEEELNQGGERIEDVHLVFTDGSAENPPGTADEADNGAFELPVTLEGTGDNAGKVIEQLEFKVPGGEYSYTNLDAQNCSPEEDQTGTPEDQTGTEEDQTGTPEDQTGTEEDQTRSRGGDQTDDQQNTGSNSTGTESTDDGSTSDGGTGDSQPTSDDTSDRGSTGSGSTGGSSAEPTATPTGDDTSNVTVNSTEEPPISLNTTLTSENTTGTNTPTTTGTESATTPTTSSLTDAAESEDQPGFGLVAGLGGLLGFGELARRRFGRNDDDDA